MSAAEQHLKDKEESAELRVQWVEHPYTSKLKKEAEKGKEHALVSLLAHCRTSGDTRVLEKYFAYERFDILTRILAGSQ